MKLLLDTHALLWFSLGDNQLSTTARSLIDDPLNDKFVSPASFWEVAIKDQRWQILLGITVWPVYAEGDSWKWILSLTD